jgi:hypothetical protein
MQQYIFEQIHPGIITITTGRTNLVCAVGVRYDSFLICSAR